jgi:hypothetical protein
MDDGGHSAEFGLDIAAAQRFMDALATAAVEEDVETYRRLTRFPFASVAFADSRVVEADEAEENLRSVAQMYRALGVVSACRLVKTVQNLADGMCLVTFETILVTGSGSRYCEPYAGAATLVRNEEGQWQNAVTIQTLLNREWPLISPVPRSTAADFPVMQHAENEEGPPRV